MYKNSCRICLAYDMLSSLYTKKQIGSYAEMVEFCTGIEISHLDTLPQQICDRCLNEVISACELKKKCIKTDDFLRKLFENKETIVKNETTDGIMKDKMNQEHCFVIELKREVISGDTFETLKSVLSEPYHEKRVKTKKKKKRKDSNKQLMFEGVELETNIRAKHGNSGRSYFCDLCFMVTIRKPYLIKHMRTVHMKINKLKCAKYITPIDDVFKCNFCEKVLKLKTGIMRHVKLHLTNQLKRIQAMANFQCFLCNHMFHSIDMKHGHIKKNHSSERKCSVCSKISASALGLENHCMSHTQELKHMCHLCGMTFMRENKLEAHIRAKHETSSKSFICDLCGMMTKQKANLKRHMRTVHMKIKEFKCEMCTDESKFSTRTGLKHHLYRFHNIEAPIKCSDCGLGFAVETFLKAHKRNRLCVMLNGKKQRQKYPILDVEVVENGFRCRICHRVYETRAKLTMHDYSKHRYCNKCDMCGLLLANYASLRKHKKTIHEKIKSYKCEFCEKLFSFKTTMMTHRNTHTGDKPFSCKLCAFTSGDPSSISKHKKKMHPA